MSELDKRVKAFVHEFGEEPLSDFLDRTKGQKTEELTIVVSRGVHRIPDEYLTGQVFYFSEGSVDLDQTDLDNYLAEKLYDLAVVLKSAIWNKIRIVPTGHPSFSMHVMLMVFRVTRLEAEVICYFGDQGYRNLALKHRQILDRLSSNN